MRAAEVLALIALAASPASGAERAAPEVMLTVDGGRPGEAVRGWPLLVRVALAHPHLLGGEDQRPIGIAPAAGAWTDGLRVAVTGPDGKPRDWPFLRPPAPKEKSIRLQAGDRAGLILRLPAEATAGLDSGRHRLKARLEVAGGSGWTGSVESTEAVVEVLAPPADLGPEDIERRQRLRVHEALAAGDLARGEKDAREWIAAQKTNPRAFAAMALVLEARGDVTNALVFANLALGRAAESAPDRKAPPLDLLDLRRRLEAAVAAAKKGR